MRLIGSRAFAQMRTVLTWWAGAPLTMCTVHTCGFPRNASTLTCRPPLKVPNAMCTRRNSGSRRGARASRSSSRTFALQMLIVALFVIVSSYGCGASRMAPASEREVNSDWCRTYYAGLGMEPNLVEAFEHCRRAAEQGDARSQGLLGWMYAQGDGVAQDLFEAARWLGYAAEQGNAAAQAYLGSMYFVGDGVAENHVEAVRWIRRAAEQGSETGQALLDATDALRLANSQERRALIVAIGAGVSAGIDVDAIGRADASLAILSNTEPAIPSLPANRPEQGELEASEPLVQDLDSLLEDGLFRVTGVLARGDDRKNAGSRYMDRYAFRASGGEMISVDVGADDFDTRVMLEGPGNFRSSDDDSGPGTDSRLSAVLPLGGTYTVAVTSFGRNETGSYELQIAAIANTEPAVGPTAASQAAARLLFDSCALFYTSDGGPVNHAEAFRYCRLAAEKGHAPAQAILGGMYLKGEGVAQNPVEAARWIRRSAEQGLAHAQAFLGVLHYVGLGVAENHVDAFKWISRSAAQGHLPARALLDRTEDLGRASRQDRLALIAEVAGAEAGAFVPITSGARREADELQASGPLPEYLGDILDDGPFRVEGRLASGDETDAGGRHQDHYTFLASAGDVAISVDLESHDFDTRLMIEGPSDFRRSDDDSGAGTNSRLSTVVLPEAGTYTIVVTSYARAENGSYELKIESFFGGTRLLNDGWVGFVGNDALNDVDGCAVTKESRRVTLVVLVPGDRRLELVFLLVSSADRFTANDVETAIALSSGRSAESRSMVWQHYDDNVLALAPLDATLARTLLGVQTPRTLSVSPVIGGARVELTYDMRGVRDALAAMGCQV